MPQTLRFLASPVRGLQAAVYILAGSALLSSLLALFRDRLFAHTFGAGAELDLYYAAFRIPDLIFVGTGALVSVYVLIPELSRQPNEEAQHRYIDTILAGFSLFAVFVSLLAASLAPHILSVLFPTFVENGSIGILTTMTRIMLLQPIFLGLSNIFAAVTQARYRYGLYALSPLLYNFGIIGGVIFFYPLFGLSGLAWGVVLGAFLHASVQVPSILRDGFLRKFPRVWDGRALISTALISVPRSLALSMSQLLSLGLVAIASSLSSGSIAIFMFAYNLQAVPLSIIGASYSTAAFPMLASSLSKGKTPEFLDHIATAARYILFWSLPASALILVLRAHIVRVILGSGAFDWTATRLTAAAFAIMAFSLSAQGLTLLLARGYYASGRTFVPFFVAALSFVATIICTLLLLDIFTYGDVLYNLEILFRLEDVPGSSVLALSISYAVISFLGLVILAIHFESRFSGFFRAVKRTLYQSMLAALVSAAAAYALLTILSPISFSSTLASVLMRGLLAGIAGVSAAALVYALMGNREFSEIISGIRSRLWREKVQPVQAATAAEEMTVAGPQT